MYTFPFVITKSALHIKKKRLDDFDFYDDDDKILF